jgi:hypothetical protein
LQAWPLGLGTTDLIVKDFLTSSLLEGIHLQVEALFPG